MSEKHSLQWLSFRPCFWKYQIDIISSISYLWSCYIFLITATERILWSASWGEDSKWIVTPTMKLSWLQAKRENPGLLFFTDCPKFPLWSKSRVWLTTFLTTKSHPRSIIQLDHPFWRLQTTRLTSKNLFKYLKKKTKVRSEIPSSPLPDLPNSHRHKNQGFEKAPHYNARVGVLIDGTVNTITNLVPSR